MKKSKLFLGLYLVLAVLVFLASTLPLLNAIGQPWPGFFYRPFYTTGVFTDPTTPAWKAGLRIEDRVIRAGLFGIDRLLAETGQAEQVYLVYELGRILTAIEVKVENLSAIRVLEKSLPMLFAGLAMVALTARKISKKRPDFFAALFMGFAGLGLVAATDYFLAPGHGLESGFVLNDGPAKWSTYFYFPLWSLALAAGWIWLTNLLFSFKRYRQMAMAVILLALAFDLLGYLNAALCTATYNNPDYIVWHSRNEFWPAWGGVLALSMLVSWRSTRRIGPLLITGLLLLVVAGGFQFSTVQDILLPGPGPQWYSLGLPLFVFYLTRITGRVQGNK